MQRWTASRSALLRTGSGGVARLLTRRLVTAARAVPAPALVPATQRALSTACRWRPASAQPVFAPARTHARAISSISSVPLGVSETLTYRLQFKRNDKIISPWHDIPLFPECTSEERGIVNYINEIPKGTKPKMEIATTEELTPIKQDVRKGKLRHFTYGNIPFNYGALPQTWEDPSGKDPLTGLGGDDDPLDVVELSDTPLPTGQVLAVKVLGIMLLIDEGETDWKLIAIALNHPLAPKLWDIADLNKLMPQAVPTIREWFKNYKTTDGKGVNQFGMNEEAADKSEAMRVVREAHHSWKDLVTGKIPKGKLWLPPTPTL